MNFAQIDAGVPLLDPQQFADAPLRADLVGFDTCSALGITVKAHAPVLELCRRLVKAGIDPSTPLEAWRDDILALRVRSIGEGARLTVKTAGNGTPIFTLDDGCKGAAAPPVSETADEVQGGGRVTSNRNGYAEAEVRWARYLETGDLADLFPER